MSNLGSPEPLNALDVYLGGTWIDSADLWEVRADEAEERQDWRVMRRCARRAAAALMIAGGFLEPEDREGVFRRAARLYKRGQSSHSRTAIANAEKVARRATELPGTGEDK